MTHALNLVLGGDDGCPPQTVFKSTRATPNSAPSASALLSNVGRLGQMLPPSTRAIPDWVVPSPSASPPSPHPRASPTARTFSTPPHPPTPSSYPHPPSRPH